MQHRAATSTIGKYTFSDGKTCIPSSGLVDVSIRDGDTVSMPTSKGSPHYRPQGTTGGLAPS